MSTEPSIFVYYLNDKGELQQSCTAFFERVARGEIKAVTSVVMAMEVIHRIMVQEAAEQIEIRGGKLIQYIKEHPDFVKGLTRHRQVPSIIFKLGVSIEPITHIHVHGSRIARQNYGLMANDSLIVAYMQKEKLQHLVTNDRDFEKISVLKVWLPR